MNVEEYLNQLNESQREAVVYNEGPSLVVAGAGSGKTRVLTYKIAYLLQLGLPPYSILALTFTNKAAREMKERIAAITGEQTARRLWMGTFHSIFSRILRNEAEHIGYPSNFTIYDATDSKSLLKSIIKEMQLDDKVYRLGMVQSRISNAKNSLITYTAYEQNKELVESDMNAKVPLLREIYKRYQNRCLQAGAMDFDDLLLQTNILFRDFPDILTKYQQKFNYILVDEYQDTNHAQFRLVQLLSQKHQNLCVVGDDDQSIYRFRGATIENILNFEKQFQNAVVIRLEQNYRSTKTILEAANDVIAHNAGRKEKTLWTDLEDGKKIIWYKAVDETDESRFVAEKIEKEVQNGASYQDFAVLYRMNAQSNNIERMFVKEKIPYHIYGGTRFYDRKEIKDVLAYMTILYNPFDMVRFKRIVNEPKRGIGDATMEMLENITRDLGISPIDVMRDSETYPVLSKKVAHLKKFALMIDELTDAVKTMQLDEFFDLLLQKTGYADYLKNMGEEGKIRLENVQELKSNILKYMKESELPSLENFLEEVSLYADAEQTETAPDTVSMMTIHAAKGLEFETVFLIGMEENIFPSARSINSLDENDLEEERRLAYVAITRAKKQLCVSTTDRRMLFGMTTSNPRSRFLGEIQGDCMEQVQSKKNVAAGTRKVEMVQSISLQQQLASRRNHHPQKTAAKSVNYSVGARVRHKIFGEGTILSVTDMANDSMLEIGFDQVGTKKVMANFASSKMQVIS